MSSLLNAIRESRVQFVEEDGVTAVLTATGKTTIQRESDNLYYNPNLLPATPWQATPFQLDMTKIDDKIRIDGMVVEALPGTQFKVELDNGHEIIAYLAGKMRKYYIRVLLGDRVTIEMSPYDMTRGRIVYRHKKFTPRNSERQN